MDGLTSAAENRTGIFDLRPDDVAANDPAETPTPVPEMGFDPELLEVYGWETSFWRKVISYFGF